MKTAFLSYCSTDNSHADTLEAVLAPYEDVTVIRDKNDLAYKDNLEDFMESIRSEDRAILIISQAYFLSKNCMKELLHLMKEKEYLEKAIPLLTDKSIYEVDNIDTVYHFWDNAIQGLSEKITSYENSGSDAPRSYIEDRALARDIRNSLDSVFKFVSENYLKTLSELATDSYRELIGALGLEFIPAEGDDEANIPRIIEGYPPAITISKGYIKYEKTTPPVPLLDRLYISIIGGVIAKTESGNIQVRVDTRSPFGWMQELNEKTGLDSFYVESDEPIESLTEGLRYKLSGVRDGVFKAGEKIPDMASGQEITLPTDVQFSTETYVDVELVDGKFVGRFLGRVSTNLDPLIGRQPTEMEGVFEVELVN